MAKSAIKEIAKLSMENVVSIQTFFFGLVRSRVDALCMLAAGVVRGA